MNSRLASAALLCSLVASVVPVLGASPAGAATPDIAGTVVNASTLATITGICVSVTGEKGSSTKYFASTTTDASGDFSFTLPAGTYNVYFTSCGNDDYVSAVYDSSSSTHTSLFDPFQVATDVITVTTGGATQDLGTLQLEPGAASLSGVVKNTSGDPIAGVCVNASPPPGPGPNFVGDSAGGPAAFSGADGSYTASGLPPGNVDVSFTAGKCGVSGYFDGWYDTANPPTNTVGIGSPSFLTLSPVSLSVGPTTNIGTNELYPIEPPTAAINSPSSGNLYALNESVGSSFSCTEAPGGPGLTSCIDSNGVSASFGSSPPSNLATGPSMVGMGQLNTSNPGTFTYSVTAESFSGRNATSNIDYVVIGFGQCESGGWQTFGVFKNQGDCFSFVATNGNHPSGYQSGKVG